MSLMKCLTNVHMCKVTSLARTLCDSLDCSLPVYSVYRILQARRLEWVAIPYSRGSSWPRDRTHIFYVSCIGRCILYHWATREACLTYTAYFLPIYAPRHIMWIDEARETASDFLESYLLFFNRVTYWPI